MAPLERTPSVNAVPLDPIHTIRAAKRIHLKDGCFVSLAPFGVHRGHLRAVQGRIAWTGPASAVERGEEVLEVWGKLVVPGLALAGVDPIAMALRAVDPSRRSTVRVALEQAGADIHKTIATQAFVECASAGVLHPIVDLRGARAARVRAVVEACAEVGLRGGIEWDPSADDPDAAALVQELAEHPLARIVKSPPSQITLADVARGHAAAPGAALSARGAAPDGWALLRALEAREPGLGLRCLASTFAPLAAAFRAPFGAFARGSWFDVAFLDYEVPAELTAENLPAFLLEAFGAWSLEAAAVGGQPVVKRHEVLGADREAIARDLARILRSLADLE